MKNFALFYTENYDIYVEELDNACVRAINDTLFLVKIKRKVTTPKWFQFKKDLRIKNETKWWVCGVKEVKDNLIILEFYKGEDKWVQE